ncbi:zeta toxin family protein [Streptomyces lavendulae]|uniref:zeta toxin family protein n=1 Tax=Streptomyces lavendulae TaxID=1914 RepID=UPI00382C6591
MVIEIAPGSAGGFVESARLYQEAGYRVELVVLGVHAADSQQGTAARCARAREHTEHGPFTTDYGHDKHFTALGQAVAAAEEARVANSVMMWRRDGTVLYRNTLTSDGWARPAQPRRCWPSRCGPTPSRRPPGSGRCSGGCGPSCRNTTTT